MVATSVRREQADPLATDAARGPTGQGAPRTRPDESGFSLVEFMLAATITAAVLGSTMILATQIQQAYGTQLDDAAVEQEARYVLEWIARDLRSAGSDPYLVIAAEQEVWIDPNGGADADDSIRVQADINPADGDIADVGENVTIAFDPVNSVITRQDANDPVDATAVSMTEAIITDLSFTLLDSSRAVTATSPLVAYVQVQVTAQSRARNPATGAFTTSTLATEVRLRTR